MIRKPLKLIPLLVLPSLLLVAAACSSNNNSNTSSNTNTNTGAAPVSSSGQASPGAGGAQVLSETTTDNKYSQTKFTVKANQPVTMTVTNKGTAIHNWDLVGQKDGSGKDIKTELQPGGQSSSVTFTIAKPGTYDFHCDSHPTEMTGKLTVQ